MILTAGELKKKLENVNDDVPVFIERIEDVYFKEYGWTTEQIIFQRDENGEPFDYTDVIKASCASSSAKRVIIYAHI